MTKRLVFWLVLVCLLASSVIMASATTDTVLPLLTTDKNVSTTLNTEELEEKYGEVFFGKETTAVESIIVEMKWMRDLSIAEPLAHVLSGSPADKNGVSIKDPYVMLMYIKSGDKFIPLMNTDSLEESPTNLVEGSFMLYAKVKLLNLGKDVQNDVRFIVFKKSDAQNLVLGKNLQVTDLSIVVRNYTFVERVKVNLNNVVDTVTVLPK